MVEGEALNLLKLPAVVLRLIRHQRDAMDALASQLLDQIFDRELTVKGLPSGHGDGVVQQNFVGDVDAGRDGRTDSKNSGVKISAIPEVLEDVLSLGKGRLTQPGDTLATHLGKGVGIAIRHPRCHVVAANTPHRMTTVGHFGRGVMGAARAKMRSACGGGLVCGQRAFLLLDPGDTRLQIRTGEKASQTTGYGQRDHSRSEFASIGHQIGATFVEFPDYDGARCDRIVVEL